MAGLLTGARIDPGVARDAGAGRRGCWRAARSPSWRPGRSSTLVALVVGGAGVGVVERRARPPDRGAAAARLAEPGDARRSCCASRRSAPRTIAARRRPPAPRWRCSSTRSSPAALHRRAGARARPGCRARRRRSRARASPRRARASTGRCCALPLIVWPAARDRDRRRRGARPRWPFAGTSAPARSRSLAARSAVAVGTLVATMFVDLARIHVVRRRHAGAPCRGRWRRSASRRHARRPRLLLLALVVRRGCWRLAGAALLAGARLAGGRRPGRRSSPASPCSRCTLSAAPGCARRWLASEAGAGRGGRRGACRRRSRPRGAEVAPGRPRQSRRSRNGRRCS